MCQKRHILFLLFREREEVAEFVEAEEAEAGVGAAEVLSFQLAKELVPAADEAGDDGQMDAFDKGEQTGITPKIRLELMEGAQAFFGFKNKLSVILESAES